MQNDISGILLFDKPANITSFDAVYKIRKTLNIKKVGHCGTLDPAATGLLIILLGKATKLQMNFMKKDKVYLASFLLGTVTDTGDCDGKIIEQKEVKDIDIEKLKNATANFVGEIEQIPPMYSALKYKGRKLYDLARKGLTVERQPRKVVIKAIDIISFKDKTAVVRTECSCGTYIRSLAEDIGKYLGCGATVASLRREKIGKFSVDNALKIEDLNDKDFVVKNIINPETLTEIQ